MAEAEAVVFWVSGNGYILKHSPPESPGGLKVFSYDALTNLVANIEQDLHDHPQNATLRYHAEYTLITFLLVLGTRGSILLSGLDNLLAEMKKGLSNQTLYSCFETSTLLEKVRMDLVSASYTLTTDKVSLQRYPVFVKPALFTAPPEKCPFRAVFVKRSLDFDFDGMPASTSPATFVDIKLALDSLCKIAPLIHTLTADNGTKFPKNLVSKEGYESLVDKWERLAVREETPARVAPQPPSSGSSAPVPFQTAPVPHVDAPVQQSTPGLYHPPGGAAQLPRSLALTVSDLFSNIPGDSAKRARHAANQEAPPGSAKWAYTKVVAAYSSVQHKFSVLEDAAMQTVALTEQVVEDAKADLVEAISRFHAIASFVVHSYLAAVNGFGVDSNLLTISSFVIASTCNRLVTGAFSVVIDSIVTVMSHIETNRSLIICSDIVTQQESGASAPAQRTGRWLQIAANQPPAQQEIKFTVPNEFIAELTE